MQHEAIEHHTSLPLLRLLHYGPVVRSLARCDDRRRLHDNSMFEGTDIIFRVGAITSRRRTRQLNAAEPCPKQLQRAQRKLSTVTACSTIVSQTTVDRSRSQSKANNDDVEATAAQLELGEW